MRFPDQYFAHWKIPITWDDALGIVTILGLILCAILVFMEPASSVCPDPARGCKPENALQTRFRQTEFVQADSTACGPLRRQVTNTE